MKTKKGKAFKGWTRFFFVLACIAFSVLIVSFFSPVLIFLVGLFSTIGWGFFIVFGSILTLGLMWIPDETKEFNQGWIDFNDRLFNSSDATQQFVFGIIPYISFSALGIFLISWLFIIIGLNKDKTHKKYYFSHMITMIVLSAICIPFAIMSLVMYYTK